MARALARLSGLIAAAGLFLAAPAAVAGDRYGPAGYDRGPASEALEAADPCAAQARVTGYGCEPSGEGRGEGWGGSRGSVSRRPQIEGPDDGDVEGVDPCAAQARAIGYGCGRDVWRSREDDDDEGPRYSRRERFVEDCIALHQRIGEGCPYQARERIVETESLPADFFAGEGGVGGGIVDFGAGGSGGFVFSEGFANASASASASASAIARVRISIMNHNHKWGGGWGHGCGCRKWR